jgi:hypothetical protein
MVSAGHHFDRADDKSWRNAWCYTVARPNSVEVRVQLADRANPNPVTRPSAPISSLETLEAAGLSIPEAFALASKCAWLDRTFAVNELEATPHARNPFPNEPLRIDLTNRVLKVSGSIDQQLYAAIRNHDFDVLEINSSGGIIEYAMRVGRQLRHQTKDVRVSGNCLSACVLVLSGGVYRDATSTARIGVHRFRGVQTTEKDIEIGQQKSSDIITYLRDMGVEIDLFQAAAAVSSDDMSYLSRADMERWKLINGRRPADDAKPQPSPTLGVPPAEVPATPTVARTVNQGVSGWRVSHSPEIFAVDPELSDKFNAKNESYNTVLRSRVHPEVTAFVQISSNRNCKTAKEYAEQINGNRSPSVDIKERTASPKTAAWLEGRGIKVGGVIEDRGFYDYVSIRPDQPNTIMHFGARFPAEYAHIYKKEVTQMAESLQHPATDLFSVSCDLRRLY